MIAPTHKESGKTFPHVTNLARIGEEKVVTNVGAYETATTAVLPCRQVSRQPVLVESSGGLYRQYAEVCTVPRATNQSSLQRPRLPGGRQGAAAFSALG